jgi:hypothetical protein
MREFTATVSSIKVQISLDSLPGADAPNYAAIEEAMDLLLRPALGPVTKDLDTRLVETCWDGPWFILEYDDEVDMARNLPNDTREYRTKFMTHYNECIWRVNKRDDLQTEYDALDEKRVDAANGKIVVCADELGMWEIRMGQIQQELDELQPLSYKEEREAFRREQERYD